VLKCHIEGMELGTAQNYFYSASVLVATKQTHISSTRDNTLHMIYEIVSSEKDEGALRKDNGKGYTKEHVMPIQRLVKRSGNEKWTARARN
jgi:hypothetical protein